jgi:hypothetical protein
MLTTTDIKNLSIALEALSRIPRVEDLSLRIQSLLDQAIAKTEEREEEKRIKTPPHALYPKPATPIDDDIPF